MPSAPSDPGPVQARNAMPAVIAIAVSIFLLHLFTNSRYGFHRDELQVLSDSMHLDWGYIVYPPLTPWLERLAHTLFGYSLVGLRLFSAIAQLIIVIAAGLMARALGGNRLAQIGAALAVALSPIALFEGTQFQYSSYEQCAWVLVSYGVVRLLTRDDPRWWLWIGFFAGVGLLSKYTVVLFVIALLGAFLLSPARRLMASRWFALGCALTVLIVLPNIIWQVRHHFSSFTFLEHIHARDVRIGRGNAQQFWMGQTVGSANPFALPLWVLGTIAALRSRRYRAIGWLFVLTVALLAISHGRGYYQAAAFPVVISMGAVAATQWLATERVALRRTFVVVWFVGLLFCGTVAACMLIPIASSGPLRAFALKNSEDLREEIGWKQLVQTVASIRDSLPPEQQQSLGILASNYGEAGALDVFGPQYHLPAPISWTNSGWFRGYPTPTPTTLIVLGLNRDDADALFTGCRLAGHNGNREGVRNEESKFHPDIFVCGPPRLPWPEFWRHNLNYG